MSTKHRDELAQRVMRLTDGVMADGTSAAESLRNLRIYAELADLEAASESHDATAPATSITETLARRDIVLSS